MTQPRNRFVSLVDTPYYHCVSRCVRRAFLCGDDRYSGQNYEHRRDWVVERLNALSAVFAIDICSYAIMSNHYHLVVYIDGEAAQAWPVDEVIARWRDLFKGPEIIERYVHGDDLNAAERDQVTRITETWRQRLLDISWYMRCLNEHIARRANAEDDCTGRFWEGRFKCQALLDETALITAMAYVDLNPIRAQLADNIVDSDKTSVQQRLNEITAPDEKVPIPLIPFLGTESQQDTVGLPFNGQGYLDLVDWTGRCVRDDKRGAIAGDSPDLLTRLGIDINEWLPTVTAMQARYELVMGSPARMRRHATQRGGKFHRGYRFAKSLYRNVAVLAV